MLANAFATANRAIIEYAQEHPECRGMGTTCTVLAFRDQQAWLAHIGDSRAYLLRDRRLTQLSEDQTLVAKLVSEGTLTHEEADHSPMHNVILQALGTTSNIKPMIGAKGLPLHVGDVFILCSDGVSNMVPDEKIAEIASRLPPQEACDALIEAALAAGGDDNASLGVFSVTTGAAPKRVEPTTRRIKLPIGARRRPQSQHEPAVAMTQTVGQYEIRDLLGEGGIGQVHAAFDTVLQRKVAMKSLRPELLSDANFVDRFRAEATSLARLNHPNITTLYSLIPDGKNFYMVMELVRGHTLDDILAKRNAPLDVRESLAIIAQAADGLAYAHSMGVIHRDIKPSNLMVAENGVLKIMDFGIARVRGSQRLTRSGSIVGTLAYMAPEQLRGEEGDEACDLYSLAIVLYEMLTGTPPFCANSEYDLMQAQINQRPDRLIPRVPGLDSKVESAIMRALSKKPAQRFASTRAFSDALGASSLRMDAPKILHNDTRLIETPANPIQIAPPRRSAFDWLPNIPGLAPELRAAVYGGGAAALVAFAVIGVMLFLRSPPPASIAVNPPAPLQTPAVPTRRQSATGESSARAGAWRIRPRRQRWQARLPTPSPRPIAATRSRRTSSASNMRKARTGCRATTSKPSSGIARRRIRDCPRRKPISATCISSAAAAWRKAISTRCPGISKPRSRTGRMRNTGSATCTRKELAPARTWRKPCSFIAAPPSTAIPRRRI